MLLKLGKLACYLMVFCLSVFKQAQAVVAEYNASPVSVRVYANSQAINPQQKFEMMVVFDIDDGWHILAPNPGDIGLPTTVEWVDNVGYKLISQSFGDEQTFVTDLGTQFGFEKNAYYLASFEPINLNKSSKKLEFKLDVSWQACRDECLLQSKQFVFSLPIVQHNVLPSAEWRHLLEHRRLAQNKSQNLSENNDIPLMADGVVWALILAFAGGIILNLMPCVLPVLSVKVLNLVKNITDIKKARSDAVFYALGVIVSFLGLALLMMILRQSGESIGWGFQLQSPYFVAVLLVIFVIVTLMFLDVFELSFSLNSRWLMSEGKGGAFLTGVFSVVIASSCSAPFMGTAIGFVLTQPSWVYVPIFLALGFGYALPFLLAGFFPQVVAFLLPKPGMWMVRLKHILAIPLILTCIWLSWLLYAQIFTNTKNHSNSEWQDFDAAKINQLVQSNQKVFVDYSAKWCLTCLMNEKAVLDRAQFLDWAKQNNVALFRADWTNSSPQITESLAQFGRNSVPLYVFYINQKSYILPQILTFDSITQYLK